MQNNARIEAISIIINILKGRHKTLAEPIEKSSKYYNNKKNLKAFQVLKKILIQNPDILDSDKYSDSSKAIIKDIDLIIWKLAAIQSMKLVLISQ